MNIILDIWKNTKIKLSLKLLRVIIFTTLFIFVECTPSRDMLLNSVESGNINNVISSLKNGADINIYNKDGYSLLHIAVSQENESLVKLLIENNINLEARVSDDRGFTPLMMAVERGNLTIVKLLVEAGANINALSKNGNMPLFKILPWSERKNMQQLAEYLIQKGLDVNIRDQFGMTPLHYVVMAGQYDYVKFLLEHGSNANIKDNNGDLPISFLSYLTKTYVEGDKTSAEKLLLSKRIQNLLELYMNR